MKLPRSQTTLQRLCWIGLLATLILGAVSFSGSYIHNSWSTFDNIWWSAFNPDAPGYWYHALGLLADWVFFVSVVLLLFGETTKRLLFAIVRWVKKGE